MPSASDTPIPASPSFASDQHHEPAQSPSRGSSISPLPASIAGAFAAAAYSMQHSLQSEKPEVEHVAEEDTGMLPQLYASRLRPRSRSFYLFQFKRFDALDRSLPSWNMAAAFFTLSWCCLNGLWREAGKYLIAVAAGALIWWFGIRPALPPAIALGVAAALWLLAMAIPGLLGNGWYWRKIKAQTLQAITESPNMAIAHAVLQAQAQTPLHKTAAMLALALPIAAATGAGLALLPATTTPGGSSTSSQSLQESTAAALATTRPEENVNAPTAASSPAHADVSGEPSQPAPQPFSGNASPQTEVQSAPAGSKDHAQPQTNADLVPGKFYLNVGVYSDAASASKTLAQLKKSKLPALTQKLASNKGEVIRVRSGPFESQKRAEKAARVLQAAQIEASIFQSEGVASQP